MNLAAVEEYQALRQRYDTLRAQVEDVEASKAELSPDDRVALGTDALHFYRQLP